jgi:shikimate dehydrogenase
MHAAAFKAAGLPHTYTPIDVPEASDLGRMVREIRTGLLFGANVTLPHKRAAIKLADVLAPTAEETQATNLLVRDGQNRVVAHNTDTGALADEIAAATGSRSRAVILGSGGGAAAAIIACKKLGFRVVGATSRSWVGTQGAHESESATALRELGALTCPWPTEDRAVPSSKFSTALRLQWTELAVQADLVVQATSAGMVGGPDGNELAELVPFTRMPKHAVALDLVYRPVRTPFLIKAEAAGLKTVSGLGMLIRQAEASYRIWIGEAPAPGVMKKAADVALAALSPPIARAE